MGNRSRLSCFKKWQKMTGQVASTESNNNNNSVEQQPFNPPTDDVKMQAAASSLDTHTAPTAGAAAAMAVGGTSSNAMEATSTDLDVILLTELVECDVRRASDVAWDQMRVDNAHERWYELLEEFQNTTTDDSVLALGISKLRNCCWTKRRPPNVRPRRWRRWICPVCKDGII